MKKIALLGSTGSIGTSTLDVVRQHSDRFKIVALSCGRNLDLVVKQVEEFRPQLVSVLSESDVAKLKDRLRFSVEIVFGDSGAIQVATHPEATITLSAIVGAAGLRPTYAAIAAGKDVALANKETMVIAGELMNRAAKKNNVKILPVDSEHSAIFQCLSGEDARHVKRLILTASGGPFLYKKKEAFHTITVEEALKHPNWSMGAKITIDSATMMNKGLELIEAKSLFDVSADQLDVVIHPQSIIHSMVEFCDTSVIAQLGLPDMRVPIALALSYPERLSLQLPSLDLTKVATLDFFPPDENRFRCLALAKWVLKEGGSMPAVLNAANEVAVAQFLEKRISFVEIAELVEKTLGAHLKINPQSLDEIIEIDQWARRKTLDEVAA